MDYMCACSCGQKHQWGTFSVEVAAVQWFLNKEHKDTYLAKKRNEIQVAEYTGE